LAKQIYNRIRLLTWFDAGTQYTLLGKLQLITFHDVL